MSGYGGHFIDQDFSANISKADGSHYGKIGTTIGGTQQYLPLKGGQGDDGCEAPAHTSQSPFTPIPNPRPYNDRPNGGECSQAQHEPHRSFEGSVSRPSNKRHDQNLQSHSYRGENESYYHPEHPTESNNLESADPSVVQESPPYPPYRQKQGHKHLEHGDHLPFHEDAYSESKKNKHSKERHGEGRYDMKVRY